MYKDSDIDKLLYKILILIAHLPHDGGDGKSLYSSKWEVLAVMAYLAI